MKIGRVYISRVYSRKSQGNFGKKLSRDEERKLQVGRKSYQLVNCLTFSLQLFLFVSRSWNASRR